MASLKKVLLRTALIALISTGLITFFPESPASLASTQKRSTQKQIDQKKQFATLSGKVTDETGAAIEGATIILRNLSTNQECDTTTKQDGTYTISNLEPGNYEVKAEAVGFKTTYINTVRIFSLLKPTIANLILKGGSTSDIIEVAASTDTQISSLPINKRNFPKNSKAGKEAKRTERSKKSTSTVSTTSTENKIRTNSSQISATVDARRIKELPITTKSGANSVATLTPSVTTTNTTDDRSVPVESNTEGYKNYGVNPWTNTKKDQLSTFAVDVDTGSYTIARRKLNEGVLPPIDSVRVEEFVNYFKYSYPNPITKHSFSLTMEASNSPFNQNRYLLRIGLKGREVEAQKRPTAHLTFLVDTSGSMQSEDKIELVRKSLKMLVNHLQPQDTVAITTYAGGVSLVLPPTQISDKSVILSAIEGLGASGSTAMEAGIDLAYKQALNSLEPKSINRVIICSDGDANVGRTSPTEILKQIEGYVEQGITVSTIGFGMGNYKDTMMEQFANKGNGNYYYVDGISHAKRIFVEQLTGTLQVIAKDVKVQVEFNPASVLEYRLVGYENRDIADEDFRNDEVDAGEIGAGHMVTAIYEVKLQKQPTKELATVRLRYKTPDANKQTPAEEVVASLDLTRIEQNFNSTSEDFRFSIAVAAFAEILRNSQAAKDWSLDKIANIAETALQTNNKERQEFFQLVKKAQKLKPALPPSPKP